MAGLGFGIPLSPVFATPSARSSEADMPIGTELFGTVSASHPSLA